MSTKQDLKQFLAVIKKRCLTATIVEKKIYSNFNRKNDKLMSRSYKFYARLKKLRIQLRYSLMALLSENKVSLFNDSIITLMEVLITNEWNSEEKTADYGAFLLDKMHM